MVFDTQNLSPKPWNITQCRNYLFSNLIRTPPKKARHNHCIYWITNFHLSKNKQKLHKNIPIEPKKRMNKTKQSEINNDMLSN